jgi:adhesin/invasin
MEPESRLAPNREGGNKLNIFAMNADGSGQTQSTHFAVPYEAGDTNWSSDGKKIAFEWDINGMKQSDPNAYAEVWTMNADGSGAVSTGVQCSDSGCAPRWQPRPAINTGGIVIHGGVSPAVSPGSLVDIYGSNLATSAASAPASANLPVTLGGVEVLVAGTPAPLIYVSGTQIVFQVPYETALGPTPVAVLSNQILSSSAPMMVQAAAPGILTYGSNRAVVVNPDNTVNAAGNGARPGSVLVAYLIGSGPLDNPIPTGASAPGSPLSMEKLATTVSVGGSNATVQFAGMTPGFAGLVQINFVMLDLAPGDYPMQAAIGGAASNQALVTVSR